MLEDFLSSSILFALNISFLRYIVSMKIYYHGDFDGTAGAVILADFFKNCLRRDDVCWEYVSYSMTANWQTTMKLTGIDNAVIDFPFHEDADWWFDHHETSLGKYSLDFIKNHKSTPYTTKPDHCQFNWSQELKGYITTEDNLAVFKYPHKFWKYDKSAQSAAQVVHDFLNEKFNWVNNDFEEMMIWANIIDGANYESPEQANDLSLPYIKINSVMEYYPKRNSKINEMVQLFLNGKNAKEIIKLDPYKSLIAEMENKYLAGRRIIESHGTYENNIFYSFVPKTNVEFAFPRYWWYQLHKDCKYHVIALEQGDNYAYRIGRNPFIDFKSTVNFGQLASKYGGGGHEGVGAITYKGGNPRKIYEEIIDILENENVETNDHDKQ